MNGLKICCVDLNERIGNGNVRLDYQNKSVTMHGQRIHKCPGCGQPFEWVEEDA